MIRVAGREDERVREEQQQGKGGGGRVGWLEGRLGEDTLWRSIMEVMKEGCRKERK